MTAISPVPQSIPSQEMVRAEAPTLREPQSPVPVGIGGTGGVPQSPHGDRPVIAAESAGLGRKQPVGNLSTDRTVKQSFQKTDNRPTLTSILEPDAFALAWAHAVRDRFPQARPLWGVSSVGNVGRDPIEGSVLARDWLEGKA